MSETFVYKDEDDFDRRFYTDGDATHMITHVIIDRSVTTVGRDLSEFPNLRQVDFHPNLTRIGNYMDCRFLEEVHLPESLEVIEWRAFEGAGIRSIIIPPVSGIAFNWNQWSSLRESSILTRWRS